MKIVYSFITIIFILSCSSEKKWQKSPVDEIIKQKSNEKSFSILLYDMDVEGNFSKTYKHQYKVISVKDSLPKEETTDWYEVSKEFFFSNENNMGMEIASKNDEGKISKVAAPPGYSNYVGNSNYGQWREDGHGSSFWEFYGQYAFMSSMLGLVMGPRIGYSSWNNYHNDYAGQRPYYGNSTNGVNDYGSKSNFARKTNSNSKWWTKQSSASSRNSSTVGNSSSSRASRSNSRYSSGSSFRSRGGGFGK